MTLKWETILVQSIRECHGDRVPKCGKMFEEGVRDKLLGVWIVRTCYESLIPSVWSILKDSISTR